MSVLVLRTCALKLVFKLITSNECNARGASSITLNRIVEPSDCRLIIINCNVLYRHSDNNKIDILRLLYDAVLPCYFHGAATSQVSLLHHQPCSTLLSVLRHLRHHVPSASCVRRTRRHRSANTTVASSSLLPGL